MALVAGSLVVPVVVWGKTAPVHRISCVCAMPSRKAVLTGTHDGQICLWTVDEGYNLQPKYLLLGHVTPILCLLPADVDDRTTKFISSAQSGKMCLWDSNDGRCIESTMSSYVHTFIQPHVLRSDGNSLVRLFCVGHYSEILILDAQNLQPLLALASRVEPDWMSAFCVLKPPQKPDVVVGISNAGMVKIWSLTSLEKNKSLANPAYEDESKQIQCYNASDLVLCPYNPRSMLIVCSKNWQVFDAGDFSLTSSMKAPSGHRWLGGTFTRLDRLAIWCSDGAAYLFQLSKHAALDSSNITLAEPLCYCVMKTQGFEDLLLDASFCFREFSGPKTSQVLLRGDAHGNLAVWFLPDVSDKELIALKNNNTGAVPEFTTNIIHNLQRYWNSGGFSTNGIIGHFPDNGHSVCITTTLYAPSQGRLVVGRQDGSIVIISATHSLMRQFLDVSVKDSNWPMHRLLSGHNGAVTALLYPYEENPRYEPHHFLSGGADFCVCLWDLNSGSLIHRFCVQAGEILRLIVPPENCNPKVLQSVCSVGTDHSVALLGLKDLRCNFLVSRHLFPIKDIRWRPLDDFLLIQCEDGTVYVWQMETGHLDRVLTGIVAEEVLFACQELLGTNGEFDDDTQAIPVLRPGKASAKQGRKSGEQAPATQDAQTLNVRQEINLAPPMLVQGVRCSGQDAEFHIVLFNVESLIMSLLVDEYGITKEASPTVANTTQMDGSSLSGIFAKAKETAGSVLNVSSLSPNKIDEQKTEDKRKQFTYADSSLNMEIAQLMLSLLHGWELDADLDRVCLGRLGLLKPKIPSCFGLISREGHLSLLLPTAVSSSSNASDRNTAASHFFKNIHWQISTSLTTQHLLAIISVANTLTSISNSGFLPSQERRRKALRSISNPSSDQSELTESTLMEQSQMKEGWSLLAGMHCVLLPDLVQSSSPSIYQAPRIELLARRWQERCMELREAAQILLLRELSRVGPSGRKALIDKWAVYLPTLVDNAVSILGPQFVSSQPTGAGQTSPDSAIADDFSKDPSAVKGSMSGDSMISNAGIQPSLQQIRRNQATAVVLLGVIGAEYGQEITQVQSLAAGPQQKLAPEGFNKTDYTLARATSQSLLELLLQPPTPLLPPFSSLRRAAIDLLGRGFVVWQPYLDISKVLLALLELCASSERLLPSSNIRFPLGPQADACRAARYALALIAKARPPAFITALSKEVARFNSIAQHQTIQHVSSPLIRSKYEILRVIEMLSETQYNDVVELMHAVGEILVHCLDTSLMRQTSLTDVFPVAAKFGMISYCGQTRKIAFGGKNGSVIVHELRVGKPQSVQAHSKAVASCAFSDDGKYLATYSSDEGKLNLWQVSQSFMGMGQSHIRLLRQMPAPSGFPVNTPGGTPQPFRTRLVWMNAKSVALLLPNGAEHRFAV